MPELVREKTFLLNVLNYSILFDRKSKLIKFPEIINHVNILYVNKMKF